MIQSFPVPKNCNLPGIKSFQFIPMYYVNSIPKPINGIISQSITIASGYELLDGYTTQGTGQLKESGSRLEPGVAYDSVFNGFVPGDDEELMILMSDMAEVDLLLIIEGMDGRKRLCGSKTNAMRFQAEYGSGGELGDTKGYSYKFSAQNIFRWPFYQPQSNGGIGIGS